MKAVAMGMGKGQIREYLKEISPMTCPSYTDADPLQNSRFGNGIQQENWSGRNQSNDS